MIISKIKYKERHLQFSFPVPSGRLFGSRPHRIHPSDGMNVILFFNGMRFIFPPYPCKILSFRFPTTVCLSTFPAKAFISIQLVWIVSLLCYPLVTNILLHFSVCWELEDGWGWRRTGTNGARRRFILLVFDSSESPGRWYFKLWKSSWKFPEFLQRRRSIDQNNQEKAASLQMPLTW